MRTTKARRLVMEIIAAADTPLDTAIIVEEIATRDKSINRATVFRTLNTLTASGDVTRVDFGEGKARYENATHHHHHLICTNCLKVDSVDICQAEQVIHSVASKKHFKVTSHKLEYFGICADCQKAKKA